MKTKEEIQQIAFTLYPLDHETIGDLRAPARRAFIKGYTLAQQESEWIKVEDRLPELPLNENGKKVSKKLLLHGKGTVVGYYFEDKFQTVEFEDWDDFDVTDYPYMEDDKEKECTYLKAGFYEELYNYNDDYYFWSPINATHWKQLLHPSKTTNDDKG